jgi:hypothetical protein
MLHYGGGLFLIGDHTNVFGMNFYLNQVAMKFGLEFKNDATHVHSTGLWSIFKPSRIAAHPVMQHVERFNYLTSCSLNAPLTAEMVMLASGLQASPGTYSTKAFFRESQPKLDMKYGFLLQTAAVRHGQRRVLAFTDSTCFSNYCVFMDEYPRFLLSAIDYLNRVNIRNGLNLVFFLLALVSLVSLVIISARDNRVMVSVLAVSIGGLTCGASASIFSHINRTNYPLPQPHSDFTRVCFVQEMSGAKISSRPTPRWKRSERIKRFNTFFIWTQRIDLYPSV